MSERSCPVSGSMRGRCPAGSAYGGAMSSVGGRSNSRMGPRGCSFSGFTQGGDLHAAFDIPRGVDVAEWLKARERKAINELLYPKMPTVPELDAMQNIDAAVASDKDLLAAALGAPARQVMIRAEEIGPQTGWKDGYLSAEYGFCPVDANEAAGYLASSPGRVWSDLCERMPGCVSRGRVRESVAAIPVVEGTEDNIPDQALWAAIVALGMLCSIYRYEDRNDGYEGVAVTKVSTKPNVKMCENLGPELVGIPESIGLPYWQVSRRMGRAIPHLTFFDQASYNIRIRDPTSIYPYVGRFDNMDLRWPMFGERTEKAFLKGCADTAASFQHGPDAMAACQEHVMNRDDEGLLREMVRLKEILERMPGAFHSISTNPSSGENYVSATEWVRWGKFSAPLSKRCPASSGLQFPPYLLMDAFLGRKKYDSFLGAEGVHLRAWLPSNMRAFIAAVETYYRVPEYVAESGDLRLMGVMDGIIEAYTGERGFMGTHRYKVFGILEVASKTGRTETNGASGAAEDNGRPWELVHQQFSDAMKERLDPHRGQTLDPNLVRGSFQECRYKSRVISRQWVDSDPTRTISMVTLDISDTGITWQPGDRLALMPLNNWEECAKVAAALGLDGMLEKTVTPDAKWQRYAAHLAAVNRGGPVPTLSVKDILRRGHLAPITKDLALKIHHLLRASSNTVLQVLATEEWPVRGSLGDLLQFAVEETAPHIWDQAFNLNNDLNWLADLIPPEVPRTYSISSKPDELLPSTVDLTISRAEYKLCSTFAGNQDITRCGVSSGFLNPPTANPGIGAGELVDGPEDVLVGVSRPLTFQLPIDGAAPCAYFAGGSGIAPFRSFWQARLASGAVGKNTLFLGVQSREKFCYEDELRQYVNSGLMEVHLAFSRDTRGLVHDRHLQDLVEKRTDPRYIDTLIESEGASVCDLVMSKDQGGLGGYLYVCGSVSVFDSVMKGIRKAIYNNRTATMESTDVILNNAFAERRFMLDVFMTPKPLPCNRPTIPLSQLSKNTGHRPGGRQWIGVHGSVYDVTDFCPMHPGGTLIIKSNAGVDCSKTFDALAHTNNPEVASLLTKYFIGHLTAKPEFRSNNGFSTSGELSRLYDVWADYLRTTVETLVSQQFEMDEILTSSQLWFQGNMINIIGVRTFYQYQTRLLTGGFSALFGGKFQELVLKLSFAIANGASGAEAQLPDILGIIARAKTSQDAVNTTKEISLVGKLICSSESARHVERGLLAYANKSVSLDMELLEDIREEACHGMDAFDTIMDLAVQSDGQRIVALATFLMNLLERMARRLEVFYSKLSQYSVYNPELEKNPARARWNALRRRIQDGSFFVLAPSRSMAGVNGMATQGQNGYQPKRPMNSNPTVDFEKVMNQIQQTLASAPSPTHAALPPMNTNIKNPPKPLQSSSLLTDRHAARAITPPGPNGNAPTMEIHENGSAVNRINLFIDKNQRAIRRLSRMPPQGLDPAQLHMLAQAANRGVPSPPSSRGSSRSPSRTGNSIANVAGLGIQGMAPPNGRSSPIEEMIAAGGLRRRGTSASSDGAPTPTHASAMVAMQKGMGGGGTMPSPALTPPLDGMGQGQGQGQSTIGQLIGKLNGRYNRGQMTPASPAFSQGSRMKAGMVPIPVRASATSSHVRERSNSSATSGNSLRSFKLGQPLQQSLIEENPRPTF
ncbi:sulfite reductase flavoprotein alpha-component [Zalerion maritima]|uniref:NADPH--hemoprotein reductase n=1 Tax=Zalerion maritima TaxID=339359 RepID=A0AAD5RMQ3_9PEZI|nr:sulfite reductase flavoprotein alpha-component [Zalerion maritima]